MDASRLLEVLTDIEGEFSSGYAKHLQVVVQTYTSARNNPTQDLSAQISASHTGLAEYLSESVINHYPPSKQRILQVIGGSGFVGENAQVVLDSRLSAAGIGAAALATAVTQFVTELEGFQKDCAQAGAGLLALQIEPHALQHEECEVGVLIPRSITGGSVAGLTDQLNEWNTILKGFSELAGEEEREIHLKGLATGSEQVYLVVGLVAAKLISHAIDKVLEWYKKILEIQEHRLKLAVLGAPVAETAAVKEHERKLLNDSISDIVRDLMEQSKTKLQANRKHEIENQITISIRHIAKFIDRGGDVEVTAGVPELPDEPAEPEEAASEDDQARGIQKKQYLERKKEYDRLSATAAEATEVSRKGAALRSLPPREKPILQLGDGDEENTESAAAKPKKK